MKKLFLGISLICLLAFFVPIFTGAAGCPTGIVTCSGTSDCPCTICNLFQMLVNIYSFIVLYIATPLAILALTAGGIMILISTGNPTLASKGRSILWVAVIGLVLVFCSYLIIDTILNAIGYTQSWSSLNISCN